MKNYSFEKLEAWQHARRLSVWIYQITKKYPEEEKFGIISQMRRAAIAIASNLAEGTSRITSKDQCHFSTIAYSSTIELLNDLIIGLLKYWRIYLVVSLLDCLIVENVYSKQRNNRNFYFSFCLRIKILKK